MAGQESPKTQPTPDFGSPGWLYNETAPDWPYQFGVSGVEVVMTPLSHAAKFLGVNNDSDTAVTT